jgi:predicted nucleotidyltransferase component of viral defense system
MIPLSAINQLSAAYRGAARQEAYLELAQEHFLDWMRTQHLFEDEAFVFKGGTAIRKFVLGKDGRFSTDLDFSVADAAYADHLLDELANGPTHHGVTFVLDDHDPVARKGTWHAETPEHGRSLPTSLDLSLRPMLLPPVYPPRAPIPGVSERMLGFEPVTPPVADILETVAEKLSRFRRVMLGRDVYDLAAVGRHVEDRLDLLREALCFKAYFDRVEEGRDTLPVPFAGGAEFTGRDARDVVGADDLGRLVQGAVDTGELLTRIAAVYGRMGAPSSADEVRLAGCRFDDRYWARTRYAARASELRTTTVHTDD